jgi:flagella synthesis protein FlgN
MADLPSRLHAEHEALKSFVALLDTEQQALLRGDIEPLLALSENKVRAAAELGRLAESRQSGLQALGAPMEAGGTEGWLKTNAAVLLPVWRSIRHLAGETQHLNHTNGVLIQSRLRHNQQALAVLQSAAHNAGGLYGPDGQPQLAAPGRVLGSG